MIQLCDVKVGDKIIVPGKKATENGLVVAKIDPGIWSSTLKVTFTDGHCFDLEAYCRVIVVSGR